jgi:hypothetical protein
MEKLHVLQSSNFVSKYRAISRCRFFSSDGSSKSIFRGWQKLHLEAQVSNEILLSVSSKVYVCLMDSKCKKSHEIWTKLEESFVGSFLLRFKVNPRWAQGALFTFTSWRAPSCFYIWSWWLFNFFHFTNMWLVTR